MRKIYTIIWIASVILTSASFFVFGNHVATESRKNSLKNEIYNIPSEVIGFPEIQSIKVISYVTNGRESSCLMIKCVQSLHINSEILSQSKIYNSIDAILGPGFSATNEIASSFSLGGSLVSSEKSMVIFVNKSRDIIMLPNYSLK